MIRVIISNGHFKFILGPAAAEAWRRGILDCLITGGYPTQRVKKWISILRLGEYGIVRRLLNREEKVPERLVIPLWLSELIIQVGAVFRKLTKSAECSDRVSDYGLRLYSYQAASIVSKSSANIYHYRSGYGHSSVRVAKQKGITVLCDHSIAHPAVLEFLVNNQGRLPDQNHTSPISKLWLNILEDVDQAGDVLVNSDFVKETFVHQGWEPERIHVIYTGLDDEFLSAIPARNYENNSDNPLRFLFAGEFGPRKGAEILIQAFQQINDLEWELEIIGNIDPLIEKTFISFLSDSRVSVSGFMPRLKLAERMSDADIFIFPSLAEGSARVVFMAMACGCCVITTPNSGSIVKEGIHGFSVQPGDVVALEKAIRRTLMTKKNEIARIGKCNADVVRSDYTQERYGEKLFNLYELLIAEAGVSHA